MNDKHIFYYNRKITLQSFTLGDPEWFKVLGPIFYILAELSILLFPANNINYRFVIVLYIADMEMQNYSIHGKKLRNTASHSTNINIAKMVGHPTFFSFVFFCSSWLCLSLTLILRLLPSKSFCCPVFVRINKMRSSGMHPPPEETDVVLNKRLLLIPFDFE